MSVDYVACKWRCAPFVMLILNKVAPALDVLHGDKEARIKFELPTLQKLKSKLNAVPVTMTKALHAALLH